MVSSPGKRVLHPRRQLGAMLPDHDRTGEILLALLFGVTGVSVAYSLAQLWHLVSGETLAHMVRTFLV